MTGPYVGQTVMLKRAFIQEEFDRFADLSGDDNPIHVDPAFSAQTKFGRTVAHGMFLYSTVCGAINHLVPGAVHLAQDLTFPAPTYTNEIVRIMATVTGIDAEQGTVALSTEIIGLGGSARLEGKALVCLPEVGTARFADVVPGDLPASEDEHLRGFRLGQHTEVIRVFSAADLAEYADLSGDTNPLFSDSDTVEAFGFDGLLVPGALIGGLFSYILGTKLPGQGTNYLKQKLRFVGPAYAGETVAASVEITRIRAAKQIVNLRTTCARPGGDVICEGDALVLVSDVA